MSREQAIEKALEKWVRSGGFRPATRSEMARELGVAPGERRMFRAILRRWQDEGRLRVGKQGRYRPASGGGDRGGLVVGTVRRWRNGRVMLEVRPEAGEASGPDVPEPVAKGATLLPFEDGRWGAALPGDLVAVKPKTRPMRGTGRGWRGLGEDEVVVQLVRIVRRARHQLVGRLRRERGYLTVVLDEPMYPGRIELSPDDALADGVANDRPVVVELAAEDWDTRQRAAVGSLVRVLDGNPADDPWMMRVILRHGLPLEFPDDVLREAEEVPDHVTGEQAGDREDWRGELVVTIDPDDAKDFDDAISVKHGDDGGWQLAVHIADVAFYVSAGSAMDREALERGNSVYLADRVIPMLPEKLSNGICSLRPGEDRLAQAVVLMIDRNGRVRSTRFADTVIHSRRRFTYAEAMQIIGGGDGGKPDAGHEVREDDEVVAMLKQARDLAMLLRKRRMSKGSLDLDMPEVRAVLDERGEVIGIERIEHDESHQLIEEFMLAANEAVAVELQRHGASGVHRVHDEPDEEKLLAFAELAAMHGHRVADPTDPVQLNRFLAKVRGSIAERSLKTALLRSLKRAEYNSQSLGHFGLAKEHYLHFTSPIRRYADLVVHRSLRELRMRRSGRGKGDWKDLRQIASHLSQTERKAADAEMESQRVKQLQYLGRMAEQPGGFQASAVIMEVRPHSMAVELEPWMIRGWIRAASLPGGRYWFDAPLNRLVCRDGGTGRRDAYRLGDRLQVKVARIDLHELQVDFEVVG